MNIKVGQKVICRPFYGLDMFDRAAQTQAFDAVVTHVNADHGWFQVEYGDDKKTRTCYRFDDIGTKAIRLV